MSTLRRFSSSRLRRGMIAVQVALSLTALMGLVAIAADGGILLAQRRHAVTVADAAALAAASDLYAKWSTEQGVDGGTAVTSATETAASNGYKNDAGAGTAAGTSTVTVRVNPSKYFSGSNAGTVVVPKGYAEVTVTYYQGRSFSNVFGSGAIPISARAVARGMLAPYSSASIIVLDTAGKDAFNMSNGTLTANGSIMVDSSNVEALIMNNGTLIDASGIKINGGYKQNNGTMTVTPVTGVAPVSDPIAAAGIVAPTTTGLTVQSSSQLQIGGNATLSPGVYTGGIKINGNGIITMSSGIYYLQGGGLTMNLSSPGSLTGTGVMIYNDPLQTSDTININANGTINLSPMTSGTYAGITMFQNNAVAAAPTITSTGPTTIKGTLYFPNADLTITGTGTSTTSHLIGTLYIVDDLTFSNGYVSVDSTQGPVASDRKLNLVQ